MHVLQAGRHAVVYACNGIDCLGPPYNSHDAAALLGVVVNTHDGYRFESVGGKWRWRPTLESALEDAHDAARTAATDRT